MDNKIKLKISKQTHNILKMIPDLDEKEFMNWWVHNKMVVGSSHLIEYLERKSLKKLGTFENYFSDEEVKEDVKDGS